MNENEIKKLKCHQQDMMCLISRHDRDRFLFAQNQPKHLGPVFFREHCALDGQVRRHFQWFYNLKEDFPRTVTIKSDTA